MNHSEKMAILMIRLAAVAGIVIGLTGFIVVLVTSGSEIDGYQQRLMTSFLCLTMGCLLSRISKTAVRGAAEASGA